MLLIYLAMVDSDEEKDLVEKLYNTYKNTLYNICFAIVRNRCYLTSRIRIFDTQNTKSE